MSSSLKKRIKRSLQALGIYIQRIPDFRIHFFPSTDSFYQFIQRKSDSEKSVELRKMLSELVFSGNMNFYQKILTRFLPECESKPETASFIGKGFEVSFKRRVEVDGNSFLEKIYLNNEPSLEVVTWFDKNLKEIIGESFKIPVIKKTCIGEQLTLLHYDFLELISIKKEDVEQTSVSYSLDLYSLSDKKRNILSNLEWPEIMLDYEKLFYPENIKKAVEKLSKEQINFQSLKSKVNRSKKILTHGDLHESNIYADSTLIDMDNFGWYPMGLDAAFIYTWFFDPRKTEEDVYEWLQHHYLSNIPEKDQIDFKQNFFYFLFLYLTMRTEEKPYTHLFDAVFKELKS